MKTLLTKAKSLVSRGRTFLSVAAGIAAEAIAAGAAHGIALHVAQAVIAAATALGAHVASVTFAAAVVRDLKAAAQVVHATIAAPAATAAVVPPKTAGS